MIGNLEVEIKIIIISGLYQVSKSGEHDVNRDVGVFRSRCSRAMSCNTRVFCTDLDPEFVVATNALASCKFAQKE